MKYWISSCVFVVVALVAVNLYALEIRVAPHSLVASSNGGKLTVHTDIPYGMAEEVSLEVNGTSVGIYTFADSLGNLVAQTTKEAVVGVVGDFDGKTTTATITLTVNGDSDSEDIRVKK